LKIAKVYFPSYVFGTVGGIRITAKKGRLGFFGFALGLTLTFIVLILLNMLPAYVLSFVLPFPWNYISPFVAMLFVGTVFYFIPKDEGPPI
jgi:hypothetical protein